MPCYLFASSEVFGLLHLTRSNFGLNGVVQGEETNLERVIIGEKKAL